MPRLLVVFKIVDLLRVFPDVWSFLRCLLVLCCSLVVARRLLLCKLVAYTRVVMTEFSMN